MIFRLAFGLSLALSAFALAPRAADPVPEGPVLAQLRPSPTPPGKPPGMPPGMPPGTPPPGRPPRRGPLLPQAASAGPEVPREALVGWTVADAATGNILEAQSPISNFTPGSTLKLFTCWLALETLGPDRTFATELFATGGVKDGALAGDLILKGGGDPGFGSVSMGPEHAADKIFQAWAVALAKLGVRKVAGCVSGDGSYLVEEGPHPASLWEDAGNYYAGNVSGLCYFDNLYGLTFDGNAFANKRVTLQSVWPRHPGIDAYQNALVTGPSGSRDSAYILGAFPSPVRLLQGTYPAGKLPFTIKGSLPNPAWTAAREFRDFLKARGIAFAKPDGPACGDSLALPNRKDIPYAGATLVASHRSAPVKDLVRHVLQKSDNNYAAQLLALSGKQSGKGGDWRGGLEAMRTWLGKNGFDPKQLHFRDGNGLSRYNWVSPLQTVHLLTLAWKHRHADLWKASLVGAPGNESKLDRYGGGWNGRLLVKTGTLEGVASLAGYLKGDSGKWVAFAVMANNYDSRSSPKPGFRTDPQAAFGPFLKRLAKQF